MDSNSLKMVVILALLATVVWSLIAVSLFSMGTEDVEIPGGIVWLSLGIIGFSSVLILLAAQVYKVRS